MSITFPLDLSGNNPANLIRNELHSVNEAKFRDFYFIVPRLSPFYIDNFTATITINNVTRVLQEDVDFSFSLPYVTGTRVTGKAMYGAITLHNLNINGIISITYQTVGGNQVADRLEILTILADKVYNPRTTIWDIVTNVPDAFPPTPHFQDYNTFFGQEQVVTALGRIRDAILDNSLSTRQELTNFLNIVSGIDLTDVVRRSGDTMLDFLTLHADPVLDMHTATKRYVDQTTINQQNIGSILSLYYTSQAIDLLLNNKVNITGSNMTGFLTLNANPAQPLHAATKQYVDNRDQLIDTAITQLRDDIGSLQTDRVTKSYVDNKIAEMMNYIGFIVKKG